jgi:hypothetical protein
MKMDRNINGDGKGKYAVVRLRNISPGDEAHKLLKRLEKLGHLDWGIVGQPDEFFLVKLRDKYAASAIRGYADAVLADSQQEPDPQRSRDKAQWAMQVQTMLARAGSLNPFCKEPD